MKTLAQIREGLWANIHAKRKRIKAGSGERMRKPFSKGAPTSDQIKKATNEAANTSIGKPDEQTGTMSWEDFYKHVGRSKAFLIAKHPQFQEHITPEVGLGAKVAFRFKRVHGFEYVDAVHGPNKYVNKDKPGRRKWLHFHLSASGKKVTQVDRYHNYDNKRHREGSLEWEHHDTWVHPTDKRESKKLEKRLGGVK
jgi:hypothetical protein